MAAARRGRRRTSDPGDRPLLLPLRLLPRAVGRALRNRDARPRFHGGRAAGSPRREAVADAAVRVPARADRTDADAAAQPAGELGTAVNGGGRPGPRDRAPATPRRLRR